MKANKEMLHSEYSKIWDERMTKYCTNKVATMAILPDGGIVPVEKESIEKDFCFGESGYDYDEAQAAAVNAHTNQDYFYRENMKVFTKWIKDLEEAKLENRNWMLFVTDYQYSGQPEDCKIRGIFFSRTCEVLEKTGPSFLNELFGKQMEIRGLSGHLATIEEIDMILNAYKEAAKDHEKKVLSYLKRYGLSKVNAWTYWRDA